MRWLHLSDLHIGIDNSIQETAVNDLVEAIEKAASGLPLDLILITGDLAYSGIEDEYRKLERILINPLRELIVTKNAKIISIPGNHDLDCSECHPLVWESLGQDRQSHFFSDDKISLGIRKSRAEGFRAYEEFLVRNQIESCFPRKNSGHLIELNDSNDYIDFICLNTAYFSDKYINDHHLSPAPTEALRNIIQKRSTNNPLFVLGHHPISWFIPDGISHFKSLLFEKNAVYLHGHEHKVQAQYGPKGIYSLGFGAAYQAPMQSSPKKYYYSNTFAICELNECLSIQFYSWSNEHGSWIIENNLPAELRGGENFQIGPYKLPLPTTQIGSIGRDVANTHISISAKVKPRVNPPVWIDSKEKDGWGRLLEQLDIIHNTTDYTSIGFNEPQGGHVEFVIKDEAGSCFVSAFSAPSSMITYEQIQHANTMLDSKSLDSFVVITFGQLSSDADALAAALKSKKALTVLDGREIAEAIGQFPVIDKIRNDKIFDLDKVTLTPLIVPDGLAILVQDSEALSWFCIIDINCNIFLESDELINKVRAKLPELNESIYGKQYLNNPKGDQNLESSFDRNNYLNRASALFDSVRYSGLAAIGLRLPTDSLRELYVPAAADVSQSNRSSETIQQALDDFVEALKLDSAQRDQLEIQLRNYYGIQRSAEAGEARRLYQNYSNILLLGDPGSGKSCFVRSEILEYCTQKNNDGSWYSKHTPVFLSLVDAARLSDKNNNLLSICVTFAASQQLEITKKQLEILLSRGQVAFFFDGLDEIGSLDTRQNILKQIDELINQYESLGNRFVVTSRPAAVQTVQVPDELTRLTLRGLTDDEIRILAERILSLQDEPLEGSINHNNDSEIISQLIQDTQEKPGIRRMARNPLLLTLLVLIYVNSGPMAARRHVVYSQAVKTLVSVRHRAQRLKVISEADLRHRLGKLAMAIYRGIISELPSRKELYRVLLKNNESAKGFMKSESDIDDFLQNVAESTGLIAIHPRSRFDNDDILSFMHHSFLEYYAAVGFMEEDNYITDAPKVALSPRWKEVITLMFGLLGEQGDITELLKAIAEDTSVADKITGSRLEIALDCALECDVPPESAQEFLANILLKSFSEGAAGVVADMREKLSTRIADLLESTGSDYIRETLADGINSDNPRIAAAFIDFFGMLRNSIYKDKYFVEITEKAFKRTEPVVRLACISSLQSIPELRTRSNLDELHHSLGRGSILEKHAVLQLLDVETGLVAEFSNEVIDLVGSSKNVLSSMAARCVLESGIFARDGFKDRNLLSRSLKIYLQSSRPQKSLSKRLNIQNHEIDSWIYSDSPEEIKLGIRSLIAVERKPNVIHDYIFEILNKSNDHSVKSSCLDALSTSQQTIKMSSLADTDFVCKCMIDEHKDVRISSIKALRHFPTIDAVTDPLVSRYLNLGKYGSAEERNEIIRSLSTHGTRSKEIRNFIHNEVISNLIKSEITWDSKYKMLVTRLLTACDQMGGIVDPKLSKIIFALAMDYRTPSRIRKLAVKVFGSVSEPTIENGDRLLKLLSDRGLKFRTSSYRAAAAYISKCKGSVDTIRITQSVLEKIKIKLIELWNSEYNALKDRIDSSGLREIRSALLELENVMASYEEYSSRIRTEEHLKQGQLCFDKKI